MSPATALGTCAALMLSLAACEGGGVDAASQGSPPGHAEPRDGSPSDDPSLYDPTAAHGGGLVADGLRWVIPGSTVPSALKAQASNNNVEIHFFEGRLYLAWRTAPNHFADEAAQILVMVSTDEGHTWVEALTVDHDADVREPRFYDLQGQLHLMYFEAGVEPTAFEPQAFWQRTLSQDGSWTDPTLVFSEVEVPWDVKVRGGLAYLTSYAGGHYQDAETNPIELRFRSSEDGVTWNTVGETATVYSGGVSEAAFEFDVDGSLWALTRNEDCDASGCGSHVCWASAQSLGSWECPSESDPRRFDSPELFRHGDEIYVVARRNLGDTFGPDGDLLAYSLTAKTTAVYRIHKSSRTVLHEFDLPGAGDTAFPSLRRTGPDSFLLANYTSPLDDPDISWLDGQISPRGTQIYLMDLRFEP